MSGVVRLFYEDAYIREFEARVLRAEVSGSSCKLVLDRTAFYPGGGGQPHDVGVIRGEGWRVSVERVYEDGGDIVHEGSAMPSGIVPQRGELVRGSIDWDRRYKLMRMHTAAHILGYVVKKNFGWDVSFAGGSLGVEESHDDFTARISRSDLPRLEEEINEVVSRDLEVRITWMSREEASEYLARFHEGLTELHEGIERIRVVEIEGLYALPCGGTHVRRTGEVGRVRLLKRESKGRGITRIRYAVV